MNIFYLDRDPINAAQCLHDTHVRKMLIESAQMLANGYSLEQLEQAPKTKEGTVRRHYNLNHPCCKWTIENYEQFRWLQDYAVALTREYKFRFGKTHFTSSFITWSLYTEPTNIASYFGWSNPPQVMPEEFKQISTVYAYRSYYYTKMVNKAGKRLDTWTRSNKPGWLKVDYPDWAIR